MAAKLSLIVNNDRQEAPESQIDRFRRHLVVYHGLADSSVDNCVRVIRMVLSAIGTDRPSVGQIERYVEQLRTSKYSWSHVCNVSLAIERYMGFLERPIKLGRPRKPKRMIHETLTEAEVAIIINAAQDIREQAILAVLAYGALRNQELCDLRVRDIDLAAHEIFVAGGKGAKDRVVYVPGECSRILAAYIHEHGLGPVDHLFITLRGGRPLRPHVVRRLLVRIGNRIKIKKHLHPHLFRHSWATNVIGRGANVRTIQMQLGHSHIETTMIYAESRPKLVKAECELFAPAYT
ncbi:MAG: tyrosine-type recombinase/integrase [Desulfobacterales bacterium]